MATKLKIERVKQNMKQMDLAEAAGISTQYLRVLENGETGTSPTKKVMDALAKALNTTVTELFYNE